MLGVGYPGPISCFGCRVSIGRICGGRLSRDGKVSKRDRLPKWDRLSGG